LTTRPPGASFRAFESVPFINQQPKENIMRKFACLLATVALAAVANADDVKLKIEGMHCPAGCVTAVDKALTKVKGVTDKKVELGSAQVSYDASKTSKKDIVAAIEKAGFKVVN
jgi:copper chaperone CopZ